MVMKAFVSALLFNNGISKPVNVKILFVVLTNGDLILKLVLATRLSNVHKNGLTCVELTVTKQSILRTTLSPKCVPKPFQKSKTEISSETVSILNAMVDIPPTLILEPVEPAVSIAIQA
jgi:hypothetical protein